MCRPPRSAWLLPIALGGLWLAGCEQNAVFELTLQLPPRDEAAAEPGEDLHALVLIRDETYEFTTAWDPSVGSKRDYEGRTLGDDHQEVQFSVVTGDADLGLHAKVRFCAGNDPGAPLCTSHDPGSPTARAIWYDFERPFHRGVRTLWEDRIDAVPEAGSREEREPIFVGKCAIRAPACIDGPKGGNFCESDGETHFCE